MSVVVGERLFNNSFTSFFVFMSYLSYLHWNTCSTNWSDLPFVIKTILNLKQGSLSPLSYFIFAFIFFVIILTVSNFVNKI